MKNVTLIPQNGSNCGLYCLKMAFDALGVVIPDATYNLQAWNAGSNVGEIFSFQTMDAIVTGLGHHATRRNFGTYAEFVAALGQTGVNPVLLAITAATLEPGPAAPSQRGHWIIVEGINQNQILRIANPWDETDIMDAETAADSNERLAGESFDWNAYIAGRVNIPHNQLYTGPNPAAAPVSILSRTAAGIECNNTVLNQNRMINSPQPLDLWGYIVEITL